MISISELVRAVILLIIGGVIVSLLWWLIDYVGIPQPFHKVAKVIIAVVAVLIVIGVLLSLVGYPMIRA